MQYIAVFCQEWNNCQLWREKQWLRHWGLWNFSLPFCDWSEIGHKWEGGDNQEGSFHQRSWFKISEGFKPQGATSAGFSGELTWNQSEGDILDESYTIWTKGCSSMRRRLDPRLQNSGVGPSEDLAHLYFWGNQFMSKSSKLAKRNLLHGSKRVMEIRLRGATFDFAEIIWCVQVWISI